MSSKTRSELLVDAHSAILQKESATVSTIQRGLNVGYATGAWMIDRLEKMGVVGKFDGAKPREILKIIPITIEDVYNYDMAETIGKDSL